MSTKLWDLFDLGGLPNSLRLIYSLAIRIFHSRWGSVWHLAILEHITRVMNILSISVLSFFPFIRISPVMICLMLHFPGCFHTFMAASWPWRENLCVLIQNFVIQKIWNFLVQLFQGKYQYIRKIHFFFFLLTSLVQFRAFMRWFVQNQNICFILELASKNLKSTNLVSQSFPELY